MKLFLLCTLLAPLITSLALPQIEVDDDDDGSFPPELLGDLRTSINTPTAQSIANILLNTGETAQSSSPSSSPLPTIASCKKSKDTCCVWNLVSRDLSKAFLGKSGRCNALARMAIRLGFHDAGTWSKSLASQGKDFGGADGSLVLFGEIARAENRGLELVVVLAKTIQKAYGVGMGDLVQYMHNHAVVTCPLGPRIRTFVGRKDATKAAPDGLLPSVSSDATTLINLFADKTISAHSLVALLGAHSTSQQFSQDIKRFGQPQDTTPGVWDVSYYNETIQPNAAPKTFRLASDSVIAKDSRCSGEWNSFISDQNHWNEDYARAYVRLSLLGVNNINSLVECSSTLPAARPTFKGSSEGLIVE